MALRETQESKSYFSRVHFEFAKTKPHCSFFFLNTKRNKVITFKALITQRGKWNDSSGKLNLRKPLCTRRPSHFLLGGQSTLPPNGREAEQMGHKLHFHTPQGSRQFPLCACEVLGLPLHPLSLSLFKGVWVCSVP